MDFSESGETGWHHLAQPLADQLPGWFWARDLPLWLKAFMYVVSIIIQSTFIDFKKRVKYDNAYKAFRTSANDSLVK